MHKQFYSFSKIAVVLLLFVSLFPLPSQASTGRIIRLIGGVRLIGGICFGCTSLPANTYDPATVAWVNAVTTAGGTVSATQEGYVDTLIKCYKSAGVFSLEDREWLLWSDNIQQAETDIINDDTWTAHGAAGFTADAGWTGDGSTSYLDTNFNPATAGGNYSLNSANMDVYVTADNGGAGAQIAGQDGSFNYIQVGGSFNADINSSTFPSVGTASGVGLWSVSRTTSSILTGYENGASILSSNPDNAIALLDIDLFIGAQDESGTGESHFTPDTMAMVGFGGGLTATQAAAKAACDNAYATSKGFNVY